LPGISPPNKRVVSIFKPALENALENISARMTSAGLKEALPPCFLQSGEAIILKILYISVVNRYYGGWTLGRQK
jgi:hypothetical protein